VRVLTDVSVVKTLYPEIIDDLTQVGQVQQGKIQPVLIAQAVLDTQINTKNKKWFYQYVDKNQEQDVQ
jgi:hypothetical protein